jgi:methyltransferase (TIGR00027 family)
MGVSRTAQFVALYRALESLEASPRIRDPFAAAFLPRRYRLAVGAARFAPLRRPLLRYADRRAPGARTSAIARTAFIDELVRREVAAGTAQLVLLGAGFDCRAHRLAELSGATVFEVDRVETQGEKRARLASLKMPSRDVRYVAVDFLRDDVGARLAGAGWRSDRPTLFVWEGVTNYLTAPAVRAVLSWMASAAAGSRVVFTYVHAGLLDGSVAFAGGAAILANVRALGEPWTFGLRPDEVGGFVAGCGLTLEDDVGADQYRARYLDAADEGYAFYRLAVARVERQAA